MPSRCKKRRAMAEMNVVPYIDVMLVLLVIFMVTAPMLQTGVQVDLPDAQASPLETDGAQAPLYVSVDENGVITLEDGDETSPEISESELSARLTGQLGKQGRRPVYIRADKHVAYDFIMKAMVAIQQAGAKKIGLIAEPRIDKAPVQ